jgi:MFS family permease
LSLTYDPNVGEVARSRALLADSRFRSLWLSQGIGQTAQNAMLFSLLVVVLSLTGSSIATSILVFCFILPSIPLGFLVGVVLDRTNKGSVLILTSALRAGGCILFFFFHSDVLVIYGLAIAFATAGLFFSPAVVSLIPSVVPRDRLIPANSLYNFTLTGSQLLGIVFVAPILLQALGPDGMFITAAVLFAAAAFFAAQVKATDDVSIERAAQSAAFGGLTTEFRESWRTLVSDRYSLLALAQLTMSATLVLLFAILIPRYMADILGQAPESAALVFAPTGIGALIGLRFLPWVVKKGKNRVVVIGLAGIAICLVLLALVEPLAHLMRQAPDPLNPARFVGISILQMLTMMIAAPMGFAYALLNAPAQTVLHERAPPEMRGRIFATQVVSANFISLIPLLIIGAITDLIGITFVLLLIAAMVGSMAAVSRAVARRDDQEAEREPEPQEVST